MKFTKIKFKLLKAADGTIQCWSNLNNDNFFETNIAGEPASLGNMKLFIGEQADITVAPRTPGRVQNFRLEDIQIQKACFFRTITFKSDVGM